MNSRAGSHEPTSPEILFSPSLMKVEQLFRLGLRSRSECEEVLQRCQWNLEQASTLMLDTYGPLHNV